MNIDFPSNPVACHPIPSDSFWRSAFAETFRLGIFHVSAIMSQLEDTHIGMEFDETGTLFAEVDLLC